MIYFTSTLLNIAVYLVTFAVMWHVFSKREAEIETNYRLSLSRACTALVDAMNAISKALDTDAEPEQTELSEGQADND